VFTRSTTVDSMPDSLDRGIDHVRDEVLPTVSQMPGFVGMSMLVDRSSGRCVVATAWQDQRAMDDSRDRVKSVRDQAMEIMGGTPQVEEWELAVMHRKSETHPGACARVTRFRVDPAQAERGMDVYRMSVVPTLDDLAGFCSASLMMNRDTGMAVSSTAYESREAMDASRNQVQDLRDRFVQDTGGEILDVHEYELALAHLHAPEMA
jgi:quinol monooxygenase YgiN